jgi:hypothetical protein
MRGIVVVVCLVGLLVGSMLGGSALADKGGNPNLGSSPLGEIDQKAPAIIDGVGNVTDILEDPSFGLEEIKTEVATIESEVLNPGWGLQELKREIAAIEGNVTVMKAEIEAMSSSLEQILALLLRECLDSTDCDSREYCAKVTGDCSGTGTCQQKPLVCPDTSNPVCGCDGTTYENSCKAALAGVAVMHAGECGCTKNSDCPASEWCAKRDGDCDGDGWCVPYRDICDDFRWDPVCGCNGKTYDNECWADLAGVNIDYEGECE